MIKEVTVRRVLRVFRRESESGLSESTWRNLVHKKIEKIEKDTPLRFYDSTKGGMTYPIGDEYRFEVVVGQDGLLVIFTEREKGVKINGVLDDNEQKVRDAVILEKGRQPRYAYCQNENGDLSVGIKMRWYMLPRGEESNGLLSSAFFAMERSELYNSRSRWSKPNVNWGGRPTDMRGIKDLLLRENNVPVPTTILSPQAI